MWRRARQSEGEHIRRMYALKAHQKVKRQRANFHFYWYT